MSSGNTQMNKKTGNGERMLCFSVGASTFAVPLLEVREVIAYQQPTPVPEAGPVLRGIINLRGDVIAVLDLRAQLRLGGEAGREGRSILIVDFHGRRVGVVVDHVESVMSTTMEDYGACPDGPVSVTCVVKHGDRLILVLDLARAFNAQALPEQK